MLCFWMCKELKYFIFDGDSEVGMMGSWSGGDDFGKIKLL